MAVSRQNTSNRQQESSVTHTATATGTAAIVHNSAGSELDNRSVPAMQVAVFNADIPVDQSVAGPENAARLDVSSGQAADTDSATNDNEPTTSGAQVHAVLADRRSTGETSATASVEGSSRLGKRGRPKGSKNKPKTSETTIDEPKPKRGRPKGSKNKPRRSLDTALHEATHSELPRTDIKCVRW
ncbi:hypothetical protein GN244_ATG00116 [Phytophthora infestans]|uniref:Uncharacterized protein n=1 Tax=Phytophthora infestans TaxID=4787 RepID=A0A833TVC5_PHYIN|nr:hypothetical protein GN244_ATG00116 [Phytophthora infestans]